MGTNIQGLARQIEDELSIALSEWTLPKGPRSMERRLKVLRRQLCLTSPGPLLRSTARGLGLKGTQVTTIAADLDNFIAQAPERLISLSAAREELAPLKNDFLDLAQQMEGSLFHSSKERRQVIDDAVDDWLACAAEALAFSAMARACNLTSDTRERLELARKCYRELFLAHIVLVPGNPTADRLFNVVARSAPPGTQIRCMAVQNIKGPGLGLARCISAAHDRLQIRASLKSTQLDVQRTGLSALVQTGGWSIPLCQELLRSIYAMPAETLLTTERDRAVKHLHHALAECEDNLRLESNLGGLSKRWTRAISGFINPVMAIPRRWRADQIINDLAENRISNARAARELDEIVSSESESSDNTAEGLLS
jgi:hypothetical protein